MMNRAVGVGTAFLMMMTVPLAVGKPGTGDGQEAAAAQRSRSIETEMFWHKAPALEPVELVFPAEFVPTDPHTLIIAMHGYGGSIEKFRRVAERLAGAGFLVALPEASYAFLTSGSEIGFDWTLTHTGESALEERAMTLLGRDYLPSLVRAIEERYPIDDVHLLGFSQGAVAALITGIHGSEVFDGVISFGLPAYDEVWLPEAVLDAARRVPILLIHGEQDDVVRPSISITAREHLVGEGFDVTFQRFLGGHQVPNAELDFVSEWIRGLQHGSR